MIETYAGIDELSVVQLPVASPIDGYDPTIEPSEYIETIQKRIDAGETVWMRDGFSDRNPYFILRDKRGAHAAIEELNQEFIVYNRWGQIVQRTYCPEIARHRAEQEVKS